MIPDYAGANVRAIVPALLGTGRWRRLAGVDAGTGARRTPSRAAGARRPRLGAARRPARRTMPTLAAMEGGPITHRGPVARRPRRHARSPPGLRPAEHGLIGYRMMIGGEILNVLRWCDRARRSRAARTPPRRRPAVLAVPGRAIRRWSAKAELQRSGVHRAPTCAGSRVGRVAGGVERRRSRSRQQLTGRRAVVCAYYDGIDKIAHERGLRRLLRRRAALGRPTSSPTSLAMQLPPGAVLLDHRRPRSGARSAANDRSPRDELLSTWFAAQSGEGRFRWLHARPGAADDLLAAPRRGCHGDEAWVVTRAADDRRSDWFAPSPPPVATPARRRRARRPPTGAASYDPAGLRSVSSWSAVTGH